VPGVLVVDIGTAQRLLKKPDQISRLLIGKHQGQARIARKCRRRPTPAGRTRCGERSGTPHRQLSPQPDGVRPVVVCGRAIHRQFGDWPRLRATPADAADVARLRGVGADAEHGIGDRIGIAGADRRGSGPGLRLPDCSVPAARCRSVPARPLRRANSRPADAQAGMVGRRAHHQHPRRAGGGRRQLAKAIRLPVLAAAQPMPGNRHSTDG